MVRQPSFVFPALRAMGVLWQVYLVMNTHIVLGHVVLFATLENKKKRETFVSLLQYPEPGSKCEALARTPMWRRPRGRAINTSLFAQPQIKVSTAAKVMN
mgnify:CR=1 FL=1